MNADLLARFEVLYSEKKNLENQLKEVQQELTRLEPLVLDDMAKSGVKSVKLGNGSTFYIRRSLRVNKKGGVEVDEIADIMASCGLGHFCKKSINSQGLRAWISEQEEEQGFSHGGPAEILPEDVRSFFHVYEDNKVVIRRT